MELSKRFRTLSPLHNSPMPPNIEESCRVLYSLKIVMGPNYLAHIATHVVFDHTTHPVDPPRRLPCSPGCQATCWMPGPTHRVAHPPFPPRTPPIWGWHLGTISYKGYQDFLGEKFTFAARIMRPLQPAPKHRRSIHYPLGEV